jgi:hypothetical protein
MRQRRDWDSGRLLRVSPRQTHRFEGFGSVRVVLNARDLAVTQEIDARAFRLHLGFRVPAVSMLAPEDDNAIIANRENLPDLVVIARPRGDPVEEGLPQTIESRELFVAAPR